MCILLLFKSVRDAITLPSAESEVLIFLHSSNLAPVAPVTYKFKFIEIL